MLLSHQSETPQPQLQQTAVKGVEDSLPVKYPVYAVSHDPALVTLELPGWSTQPSGQDVVLE